VLTFRAISIRPTKWLSTDIQQAFVFLITLPYIIHFIPSCSDLRCPAFFRQTPTL